MKSSRRLFQFDFDTVDAMLKFIKDNNIQCDLNQCGSISFAMNEKEAKDMENYMSEVTLSLLSNANSICSSRNMDSIKELNFGMLRNARK